MTYDDLEQHYCTAEEVMQVSGPPDSPMPRSRPFQLPPHRLSDPEVLAEAALSRRLVHRRHLAGQRCHRQRGICCASGICEHCPVDAKFTIQNGLAAIYQDPRVTLQLHSRVNTSMTAGGIASSVDYMRDGRTKPCRRI